MIVTVGNFEMTPVENSSLSRTYSRKISRISRYMWKLFFSKTLERKLTKKKNYVIISKRTKQACDTINHLFEVKKYHSKLAIERNIFNKIQCTINL